MSLLSNLLNIINICPFNALYFLYLFLKILKKSVALATGIVSLNFLVKRVSANVEIVLTKFLPSNIVKALFNLSSLSLSLLALSCHLLIVWCNKAIVFLFSQSPNNLFKKLIILI